MDLHPNTYKCRYTILFLGSNCVGKTCIIDRMRGNQFQRGQPSTIGIDFSMRTVNYKGRKIVLRFFDTAGQEKFKSITKLYYKDCYAVVVVFSIDDPYSLQKVPEFMRQFQLDYQNSLADQNYVPITILAQNKTDRESMVSPVEIQYILQSLPKDFPEFKSFQSIKFFETSALNGQNIQELIDYIVEQLDVRGAFLNANEAQSINLGQRQQQGHEQQQKKKKACES